MTPLTRSRRCFAKLLPLILLLAATPSVDAGGGPEGVAVVVNARSWASRAVANHYVQWRQIPPANVVLLDLEEFEQLCVDGFREQILQPTLETLRRRGVLSQIDCVAYSSDVPTAINVRADVGAAKLPQVITPVASLNGLTYLYQQVLRKDINYLQLNSNRYMRLPQSESAAELSPAQQALLAEAAQLTADKKWSEAAGKWRQLAEQLPTVALPHYNLACCLAQAERSDDAVAALRAAVEAGWSNRRHAENDNDLRSLREREAFQKLLERMEQQKGRPLAVASESLRGSDQWDPQGARVASGGQGYLLSTVLGVTSGRGNSVEEVLASLRRSVEADAARPTGTIYFPTNGDVRSRTRHDVFPSAAAALRDLNVPSEVAPGILPQGKSDIMGAMVGAASFDFSQSGSRILPGAICEHLTSFGGIVTEGAGQTPLTEWIRHGAAGSSGTVTEPYALQAKFPFAYLHVHYARGSSLAEAFYQSVHGPYQLLIVGDPLCQPWAQRPEFDVPEPPGETPVKGTITLRAVAKEGARHGAPNIAHLEWHLNGRRFATTALGDSLKIATTGLDDGWHELRVVAIAEGPLAARSVQTLPLLVGNHGLRVDAAGPAEAPWGDRAVVEITAPPGSTIRILHCERAVAMAEADANGMAKASLDTAVLGQGPVTLQAVAVAEGRAVRAAPLSLLVAPPAIWRPAPTPPREVAAADDERPDTPPRAEQAGLALRWSGQSRTITETRQPKWLSETGLPAGPFTLSGQFELAAEQVVQFQLRGDAARRLRIDGRALWSRSADGPAPSPWVFLPIHLSGGRHRLELQGEATGASPQLQLRMGGPGATSVDGERFRH